MNATSRTLRRFSADERGGIGLFVLFLFVAIAGVCGVAVDMTNGYRYKTILQSTADAAALAAVIDLPDADAARATAMEYAQANLAPESEGFVLRPGDIVTGAWHDDTRTLDTGAGTPDTVVVTVRRAEDNDNALSTSFLRLIGLRSIDVTATAGAMRYYPGCLSREGFISAKRVRMTTDTHYVNDFCIYGANGVSVNNGNSFETGVKVTMGDLADFSMPTDGFNSNPGLEEALGIDFYDLFILELIDEIVAELKNPASQWQPSYIDRDLPALTGRRAGNDIAANGLAPYRVHYLPCNAGTNTLQLPGGMLYRDVVIVTDCRISIGSKAQFQNVTMATTWSGTSSSAVDAASQVEWGADDNCSPGGGVRVLAPGSISVSAQNYYYGGQFISRSTVSVSANVDGGTGVSVISAEDITLTSSHGFMGLCEGVDMDADTYQLTYFRLVI